MANLWQQHIIPDWLTIGCCLGTHICCLSMHAEWYKAIIYYHGKKYKHQKPTKLNCCCLVVKLHLILHLISGP